MEHEKQMLVQYEQLTAILDTDFHASTFKQISESLASIEDYANLHYGGIDQMKNNLNHK